MSEVASSTFLSPNPGEVDARPDTAPINRSLALFANALTTPAAGVLQRLETVVNPPASGVGLISACAELVEDLRFLPTSLTNPAIDSWSRALTGLLIELKMVGGMTEAQDRAATSGLKNSRMTLLLTRPSMSLPPDTARTLRAMRGLLFVAHLDARRAVPPDGAATFARLLGNPKTDHAQRVLNGFSLELATLVLLRAASPPDAAEARLLTLLIRTLDSPIGPAPEVAATVLPLIPRQDEAEQAADENDEDEDASLPIQNSAEDLIAVALSRINYARPRDSAGVSGVVDFLQPYEYCEQFPRLIADLAGNKKETALAALVSTFVHARPNQFKLLPLARQGSAPVWLDFETGHLCWVIESVVSRKKYLKSGAAQSMSLRPPLRVPLPLEVVRALRELYATTPFATVLGELFSCTVEDLDRATKKYLKSISTTSHRLTVDRLSSSYGRFILSMCQDETLAAALSLDFTLGTPANFNYWPLRARRITEVATAAYLKLGFSGEIVSAPLTDTGSLYVHSRGAVASLLMQQLNAATDAFARVHNKSSDAELIKAHNVIAPAIFAFLLVVTQHRKTQDASFAMHTIDLALAIALIGDKRVAPYHFIRLVPLPTLAVAWIEFYLKWLELLRYRFERKQSSIAQLCDSILHSSQGRAAGALFFVIDRRQRTKTIGTKALQKAFAATGLPVNIGRHWSADLLVAAGCDSALVMATAGRGSVGQEAFGGRSALDPTTVMNRVRTEIDAALCGLALPHPPALKARPSRPRDHLQASHSPYGFRPSTTPIHEGLPFIEPCPFSEFSISNSRRFVNLRDHWCATAPTLDVVSVTESLIFRDKVTCLGELLSAVRELLSGRIYCTDERRYFVDTNTKALAIRRVWLDPATIVLAAHASTTSDSLPSDDTQLACLIRSGLAKKRQEGAMEGSTRDPLATLLDFAGDYVSLRAPGTLREWMLGRLHARTSRPETTARHESGFIEHPRPAEAKHLSRARRPPSGNFLDDAIRRAEDSTANKGGNDTRLHSLQEELQPYCGRPLGSAKMEMSLKYVMYLIHVEGVESPSTIRRYLNAVMPLIDALTVGLDSLDELDGISWMEPVKEFRRKTFSTNTSTHSSEAAGLNHLFDCFDIDLRLLQPKDPLAAARRYADHLSEDELRRAIPIAQSSVPDSGHRTEQTSLLMQLIADRPWRWNEVSRIRMCDASFGSTPHLIATHETIGTVKSRNTDRPLTISDPDIPPALARVVDHRKEQFPKRKTTFLFGDADDPATLTETDNLGLIINEALYAATGSPDVSIHDARGLCLSRQAHQDFHVSASGRLTPLELRQAPYALQVLAGHGDFSVTAINYLTCFARLRREWADHWLVTDNVRLSPSFISTLSGVPADTLRTRARRAGIDIAHDPMENFQLADFPAFAARARHLKDMVVPECRSISRDAQDVVPFSVRAAPRYVALRLLGISPDTAAFEAQIDSRLQMKLEAGLKWLAKDKGAGWQDAPGFSVTRLRKDGVFDALVRAIAGWKPLTVEAIAIVRAIPPTRDGYWEFNSAGQAAALSDLWLRIARANIEPISCHDATSPTAAKDRLSLSGLGANRQRSLAHRNFSEPGQVKIAFLPKGTSDEALPRVVGWTTFLVSAAVISSLLPTLGDLSHG